jgi:hypothetical protein
VRTVVVVRDLDNWFDVNRANWDARSSIHLRPELYVVDGFGVSPRVPYAWESIYLGPIGGLRMVHLQCRVRLGLSTPRRYLADSMLLSGGRPCSLR